MQIKATPRSRQRVAHIGFLSRPGVESLVAGTQRTCTFALRPQSAHVLPKIPLVLVTSVLDASKVPARDDAEYLATLHQGHMTEPPSHISRMASIAV